MNVPREFLSVMKARLGADYDNFLKSYEKPVVRGVRANTLKISVEEFEKISPVILDGCVPWEKSGFYTLSDSPGKTIEHAAGLYYVQEPSAMCAAPELDVRPGERVLDLCSAPGGKGTQLAQYMDGEGVLVLNEINYDRFKILESNVERMGIKNTLLTSATPEVMAELFGSYFDKILVDAPCSGEGMFKKEPNAIPEWSLKNVEICAKRQKNIIECADRMLAVGGRMVYSTCTFSSDENERQIESFLKNNKNYKLLDMKRLLPHNIRGEGHFCAVLEKTDGKRTDLKLKKPCVKDGNSLKPYREWEAQTLGIKLENVYDSDRAIRSFFDGMPDINFRSGYKACCAEGLFLGCNDSAGKRFIPSHRLAMALKADEAKSVDVDEYTALNYLHGLTFEAPAAEKGWNLVTYRGYPLGWCKVVEGVAKNHLPSGLRI